MQLKLIIAGALFVGACAPAWAKDEPRDATTRYYANKKLALQSIDLYLNQYFASQKIYGDKPYDFTGAGKPESRYKMGFRIVYPYASASITPRDRTALDPYLPDGSGFLLRKEKGRWKVLRMGTSFHGADKEFGISADKWKQLKLR